MDFCLPCYRFGLGYPVKPFFHRDVLLDEMPGMVDSDELFHSQDRPEKQSQIEKKYIPLRGHVVFEEKDKCEKDEDKLSNGIPYPEPWMTGVEISSPGKENGVDLRSSGFLEFKPAPRAGKLILRQRCNTLGAKVLPAAVATKSRSQTSCFFTTSGSRTTTASLLAERRRF